MASKQKVSCNQMKKDAEDLSAALQNLPQIIEQLRISMESLAGCWEGPAWAAYQTKVNEDIENMKEIYQVLLKMQKALGDGRGTYLKAEYDIYTDIKYLLI